MDKGTHYDKEFDRRYAYEGWDLGCACTPDQAVFKLWSPEAARVELFLYRDGDAPAYASRVLEQEEQGVWALTLEGDCHGVYYDYEVTDRKSTRLNSSHP